jgi:hypothetical protein
VETEALAGLVERVTFQSLDNGFCVLRINARGQRELTTLVGHAATVTAGEFVQMSGALGEGRFTVNSSARPSSRPCRRRP